MGGGVSVRVRKGIRDKGVAKARVRREGRKEGRLTLLKEKKGS